METQRPVYKIEITTFTFVKIVAFLLLLAFLWFIRDILLLLFVTLILVTVLHPFVDQLHKAKIPRIVAVLFLYLIIIGIFIVVGALIAPILADQINDLIKNWPDYVERFSPAIDTLKNLAASIGITAGNTRELLSPVTGNLYGWTVGLIGTVVSILIVLLLTFYVLLEKESTRAFWLSFIPQKEKPAVVEILNKIAKKWGAWVRGQVILGSIIGVITYIALAILSLPFALTLAVWAGLMEFVPFIGPWIAAIPAIVVAIAKGGWVLGLIVFLIYFIIQQLEGAILVPKIMQKAVGLSPVAVIVAVLVGAKVLGIIGVILAVPIAAGVAVIIPELKYFFGKVSRS